MYAMGHEQDISEQLSDIRFAPKSALVSALSTSALCRRRTQSLNPPAL